MINLSLSKQLDILMPNTNKALAVILEKATPEQLISVTKDKDLKSIMNSLLKESSQNSQSDKTLLNLLKSNPTLKSLGNISNNIKNLLNSLESSKTSLPIQNTLKNFLIDIKELSEPILKQKLENSGVFLESKLKNIQNPKLQLKELLTSLNKELTKSDIFSIKLLSKKINTLLGNEALKNSSNNDFKPLAKAVENIVSKLQEHLKSADSITSKSLTTSLSKLEHLITPKLLTPQNFKMSTIVKTLEQISTQLTQSTQPQTDAINKSVTKIVTALQNSSLESFTDKKVPQDIKNIINSIKDLIEKTDPVFSKKTSLLTKKLTHFSDPKKFDIHHNTKELLSHDLKSVLLKSHEEISNSTHPNKTQLLQDIDKLSLQIDYHQLLSHLSNSSSLYIPFSWEELQEGNINIKKDKDEKFYCDIDLKLKEYGELKLKLVLYEKNQLNIKIHSNNKDFKEIIKENISLLRSALIEAQITPREIRLFNIEKQIEHSPYENSDDNINIGFEVKA
jgi:hypothetical protein